MRSIPAPALPDCCNTVTVPFAANSIRRQWQCSRREVERHSLSSWVRAQLVCCCVSWPVRPILYTTGLPDCSLTRAASIAYTFPVLFPAKPYTGRVDGP